MGYYLLDHPNPNAFGGFHGYTTRRTDVRLLVIHTTENAFDVDGPDLGAENVAGWLSRTIRQASYHDVADSDSLVKLLPHSYTAFGARGHNSHAIHMAFAGQASKWHTLSDSQVNARLKMLAGRARAACADHDIPVRRLHGAAARESYARGVCGHGDLDPSRRTDPGSGFPWDRFLRLLDQEDQMTPEQEAKLDETLALARWLKDRTLKTNMAVGRMEKVHGAGLANLQSGDVDVDALAAALSDELGADVAAELGRRLTR